MAETLHPKPKDLPCPQCESETDGPHCLQRWCPWRICSFCKLVVGTRLVAASPPNDIGVEPSIPRMPVTKP